MDNYYFDMDGVLVVYDWGCYEGNPSPMMTRGSHCFLDLKPDMRAIELMHKLHEKGKTVKALTGIINMGSLYLEHTQDKIKWLAKYVPFLDPRTQFLPSFGKKRDLIELIRRPNALKIHTTDVLIDDWNPNLTEWHDAGGLALKYLNGVNSPNKDNPATSYDGLHLTQDMSINEMIELLEIISNTAITFYGNQESPSGTVVPGAAVSACDTSDCAYNHCGMCRYHAVHGTDPLITESDGCMSTVLC